MYRDIFGDDELLAYELYDEYKDYAPGTDAVRFAEPVDGLTVYVDNTIEFEYVFPAYDETGDAPAPLRLVIAAQNRKHVVSAVTEGVEVAVEGTLPEAASVDAYSLDADEYSGISDADVLLAVDISLRHEKEGVFTPDNSVTVTLSDPSLAEASESGAELELVRLDENGEAETMPDARFSGGSVSFDTDELGAYAVIRRTLERTLTASDGNTYSVSVSLDAASGVPANAELAVAELDENTAAYSDYVRKASDVLGEDVQDVAFAHAFDIKLIDPVRGKCDQIQAGNRFSFVYCLQQFFFPFFCALSEIQRTQFSEWFGTHRPAFLSSTYAL